MPLLSATCSGCCSVNSIGQYEALYIIKQQVRHTLDGVPERRDGFDILVQRQRKSVYLLLVLHDEEGIIGCDD